MVGALAASFAGAAFAQADNTNSKTSPAFGGWMTDWSMSNNGRISREAYMREQERRWDLADAQKRGLTVDEINRAYGYTWSTPTPMGTNANPGNMGPGNVKGK
jgi:hypothetical protein